MITGIKTAQQTAQQFAPSRTLNAQPVSPSGSGYVISYRFGPLWFNELYII